MNTIQINKKDIPAVILKACSWYKGRRFRIQPAEKVTLSGCAWDGGSKSDYTAINLDTGQTTDNTVEFGNMFTGAPYSATVELPENCIIIEHSYFCGKDMGLRFYVHPSMVAKLLPAKEELPEDQRIVLAATAGYKSSYAGVSNYRFQEANRKTGISLDRWNSAKASLIASKHLNRAGAITPKGRNAVGNYRLR